MSHDAEPQTLNPMSPLTEEEQDKLKKINRFLTQAKHPHVAPKLRLAGYTNAQQRTGQTLYTRAAGFERSLDEFVSFSFGEADAENQKPIHAFRTLDAFENKWFPRMEPLLRRFIEPAKRDAFISGFFKNLTQQPLGPAVVDSVERLLKRIDGLQTSTVRGAKEAHQALVERGLSPDLLASIRAELTEARAFTDAANAAASPVVDPAQVAASAQDQRDAFDSLVLWYDDWAATLRDSLDHNNLLRLGLREPKPRTPKPPPPAL
jgi:hypothetical protein